jgi:two-component system phosphate regulon sensor histidine kinase PhoR
MAQGNVPPDKVQEFSGDIYRESQRLIDLVNDIIHLSRLDEEGYEPELETVELQDLAADTIENLRATAEKADVKLCMTGSPVTVDGVWALLGEMVYNLCDNAIKYNRPGGIVTMETGTKEDGRPFLSVADTGIGIPKAAQDRVFERFYRVDKARSRKMGGTGLGLAITKQIVEEHQGTITAESALGKGTKFTITLPRAVHKGIPNIE